jgi:hypothetical protein
MRGGDCYSMVPSKFLAKMMAVCCTFVPYKPYRVPEHHKPQSRGPDESSKHRYSWTPPVSGYSFGLTITHYRSTLTTSEIVRTHSAHQCWKCNWQVSVVQAINHNTPHWKFISHLQMCTFAVCSNIWIWFDGKVREDGGRPYWIHQAVLTARQPTVQKSSQYMG